ncbi:MULTISPECIES: glycoside hydrolase family 19 protein [unclassified Luteimonas]
MNMAVSPINHTPAQLANDAGARTHTVQYGDMLSALAVQYGIPLQQLIQANPQILNPDLIYPGEQIQLPTADSAPAPSGQTTLASNHTPAQLELNGTAAGAANGVSAAQLMQIVPTLSADQAPAIAQSLNVAMAEANINTPQQQAMFIAQLAHESGGFHYMEEIASGAAYEGRSDLGNTQAGDGVRYKGRGYIQVTGRYNYSQAGQALGLDLVNNPGLAAKPENAARIAAWYWTSRDINETANTGDFVQVTRLINGGTNGLADRQAYYARAQAALA